MPKVTCPECDETVTLPASARSAKCPACGTKVVSKARVDDSDDESEEEEAEREEREPRKKKKKRVRTESRDSEKIRGLIPALVVVPVGLALAIMAPFSGYGTALSMVLSFPILVWSAFVINRIYHKTPGLLEERIRADAEESQVMPAIMLDCLFCAFSRPKLLGAWVAVFYTGLLMITMGVIGMVVFKRMEEGPGVGGPGQNPPPQVQPKENPPEPKDTDEQVVTKAIAALDKKTDESIWLARLVQVKSFPQRDAVVPRLIALTGSQDGVVRVKAAEALGLWANLSEGPALIKLLDDPDVLVRQAGMNALVRLRDERGIPALVKLLTKWGPAKEGLIAFGAASEPALLPYLTVETSRELQEPTITVIKAIGTEKSIPALEKLARLPEPFRANPAKEALDAIRGRKRTQG